jgi:hypothetical protein
MQKEYLCNAYHVCYVVPTATEVLPNYRLVRLITPECIYYVKYYKCRLRLAFTSVRLANLPSIPGFCRVLLKCVRCDYNVITEALKA